MGGGEKRLTDYGRTFPGGERGEEEEDERVPRSVGQMGQFGWMGCGVDAPCWAGLARGCSLFFVLLFFFFFFCFYYLNSLLYSTLIQMILEKYEIYTFWKACIN